MYQKGENHKNKLSPFFGRESNLILCQPIITHVQNKTFFGGAFFCGGTAPFINCNLTRKQHETKSKRPQISASQSGHLNCFKKNKQNNYLNSTGYDIMEALSSAVKP